MGFTGGNIRVWQNGIDRTNWLYYGSSLDWNTMRGGRGTCQLPLYVEPGDSYSPQVGETIEIYDPATTRVWAGTVDSVEITWLGDSGDHVITLYGISLEALFDTAQVDKVEYSSDVATSSLTPPFYAGDIVADLYAKSGVTEVTLGMISPGPLVSSLQVTNIAQAFADLALLAGFVWYVDPSDKKLYFTAPGARAAGVSIIDGDILWETSDWKQSSADFRDAQVVQLPGVAQAAATETFAANGSKTKFTLADVPSYLVNVSVTPLGIGSSNIAWAPGDTDVYVTPAVPAGNNVVITYQKASTTQVVVGGGSTARRYVRSRTFTPDGAIQEATAMVARYSLIPSTLQFQTDRPGVGIGRALTIAISFPAEAGGLLNGTWLVTEVDATLVPGLDQRAEPWGHFRYTIYAVNTAATAIFPGDGETTVFTLPVTPATVATYVTNGYGGTVTATGPDLTATPAPETGQTLVASYTSPDPGGGAAAPVPDVPSWVQTLEQSTQPQTPDAGAPLNTGVGVYGPDGQGTGTVEPGGGGGGGGSVVEVYQRTLLLKDLTVGDDIADHVPVYHAGMGVRLLAVLRKSITADLTVRIWKHDVNIPEDMELATITVPAATAPDVVLEWPLLMDSPAQPIPFLDKQVLRADILESDASTDVNGICSITVEWSDTETV
jgi:hypothetical protein